MARTPQEEQKHRFAASSTILFEKDPFHINIVRALRASISLNPATSPLTVCFVDGGGTQLDLMFDKDAQCIKIHQKWLNFDEVHKEVTCDILDLSDKKTIDRRAFYCDHIVEDILELIVKKIGSELEIPLSKYRAQRGQARKCLRSMPRLVQSSQSEDAGVLNVSWVSTLR